ncbi:hypothetical protein AVEN_121127-1 [Araneus ventricosus]|uniref:ATP-dependent DNA helicase n=1 Tax=Araneus ventricosus TaxID=182803 RepID=A0A4Y2VLW5_ARAVE|nr:hypothetical protein AVEN_121127-1 [Araneus ventricosus]
MKGGRTAHSGFKLPVPLLDTSVSSMRPTSPEADKLRQAVLIIIDQITMLTKDGLRCIDSLLRHLMNNDKPLGGKVIIIGCDFRQTLPVVPRGTRAVIESCIKSNSLWSKFTHLSLTTNIRCAGQTEHNMWLLNIGSGNLPVISGLPCDSIEIPQQMVLEENLIEAICSENLNDMEVEELAKHVILAPTNKKTLEMNRSIIAKLHGQPRTFYSPDSIISEKKNDLQNSPPEFLADLTPSGMPPHALMLKKGVIVMLLRNLNPKQGLCNGTCLLITCLHENSISQKIVSECNRGCVVFLPRIELAPCDVNLPFVLKSR